MQPKRCMGCAALNRYAVVETPDGGGYTGAGQYALRTGPPKIRKASLDYFFILPILVR
jgi:hypothetical protein